MILTLSFHYNRYSVSPSFCAKQVKYPPLSRAMRRSKCRCEQLVIQVEEVYDE